MSDQREPALAWVFAKATLFTLLVPGTVVVLVPYLLLEDASLGSVDVTGLAPLGLLPIVLGAALYLRCAFDFAFTGRGTPAFIDAPIKLVIRGPYRYCRNPMYVGILTVLAGEALLFSAARLLVLALVMALAFCWFIFGHEERALRRRFGDDYVRYCAAVPRWLPNASGLRALYSASFLKVGAFVLAAGAVAHLARLTVALPVSEMPVSIHVLLVVLPGYAAAGCIVHARRIELAGAHHKLVFTLITALLVTTAVMHAYSIAAGDDDWLGVFPPWYSAVAAIAFGGFAYFLTTRRLTRV